MLCVPNPLIAQTDVFWNNAAGGDFESPANWVPGPPVGGAPDASKNAYILVDDIYDIGFGAGAVSQSLTYDKSNSSFRPTHFFSRVAGASYSVLGITKVSGGTKGLVVGRAGNVPFTMNALGGLSVDGQMDIIEKSVVNTAFLFQEDGLGGVVQVASGAQLIVSGVFSQGSVWVDGESSYFNAAAGGGDGIGFFVDNGGTFDIDNGVSGSLSGTLQGGGTVNINGTLSGGVNLENYGGQFFAGDVDSFGGFLGTVDSSHTSLGMVSGIGQLQMQDGDLITQSVSSPGGGLVLMSSGASWVVNGNMDLGSSTIRLTSDASIEVNGNASMISGDPEAPSTLVVDNASFSSHSLAVDQLSVLNGALVAVNALDLNGGRSTIDFQEGTISIADQSGRIVLSHDLLGSNELELNASKRFLNSGKTTLDTGFQLRISDITAIAQGSLQNDGVIFVDGISSRLNLGRNTRHDGYSGTGELHVGANSVQLLDRGLAQLGTLTTVGTATEDGTLRAVNGIALSSGGTLLARGQIDARFAGGVGSAIYAEGGDLVIGRANHVAGFAHAGELHAGRHTVTIQDLNRAQLGSYTRLGDFSMIGPLTGPGTLDVQNGAVIDLGGNLVGYGTIDNQNTLAAAIINNGSMLGRSASDRLIVEGYVKGVGEFDNVQFNGTFSPGLSPTISHGGNFFFGPSAVLEMEIGGLIPGDEHDAISADGLLSLDGTLDVVLINGFEPMLGDSFDLFDWSPLEGTFDSLDLPELAAGLRWDTEQLYASGVLAISSFPGDFDIDGNLDCDDINALSAAIAAGSVDTSFDMNGDGVVTRSDIVDPVTGWLAVGGAHNSLTTGGGSFLDGDANLDGAVDDADFDLWNSNRFSANDAYCSGDFNADAYVDVSDFGIWNRHKSLTSGGGNVVPEPAQGFRVMFAWAIGILFRGVRQRRNKGDRGFSS